MGSGRPAGFLERDRSKNTASKNTQRSRSGFTLGNSLPHFGCQGDLSLGNLGCTADGDLIIFDYNIAGEAVLDCLS